MKRVLGTFAASLVLIWGFLLFGGGMLLQNTWGALVLCALVVTVLAQLFEGQADRGEELEKREQFYWMEGALLLFHGSPRKLHFERDYETERFRVCDTGDKFLVSGPFTGQEEDEPLVKAAMENWYRKQARRFLEERTAWWADRMGVSYLRIAIRDQATRWGSCSARGNINYNWKLVLLPVELADYVVVHELAHRTEMNHSKDFWKVVERELPDYRQRRRRLKGYESEINQKYQD